MYSSHLLSEAVNVEMPFSSTLEAIISNEYGSSLDVLDIDDECDPIAQAVNIRIRHCMQISLNGLHEILVEALDMFSNPDGSGDGNLTNNDDIGELHQKAIQQQQKNRCDILNKALYEAQWTSRTVWRIIRLAHALRIEAHTVIEECDAWGDNDSKGERKVYVCQQINHIADRASNIMVHIATILKAHHPALQPKAEDKWAKDRVVQRESSVMAVINLCQKTLQAVEEVLTDSLDW
ncbi:hypothetical protein DFJ58DRAFT_837792 [Suillus subalutaceus]|uniref:uncharacterized protein n=1 Tax=Suillus subalutaceus TaxID=48586 RepID=UPI001B864F0C|nr:uncharacterized protein DFJ58DRAFT_837792 [Suillus subalutaceus]KAG1868957.1 hypothetical protein DFJ58DRAFT_837792 [Suillus subalutaceus]